MVLPIPSIRCCFLNSYFFSKEKKALAFNRDRCCLLVLCLQLILFHCEECHYAECHYVKCRGARETRCQYLSLGVSRCLAWQFLFVVKIDENSHYSAAFERIENNAHTFCILYYFLFFGLSGFRTEAQNKESPI
jgi:hypothetical protein